mgnify:FL=1
MADTKTKEILITGSSRGIGKATAKLLAKQGYKIVLHCNKNIDKAKSVQKEIGENSRILQFDISNREQTTEILTNDIAKNGVYFGLVLNAGITKDNVFPAMEDDEWDSVINTNLNGFYNVVKPLILPMIQSRQKSRIVTLSSVSGLSGNRGQVNYSASKAGIIGATKALSLEVAKRGITVNCVAPGVIESDMTEDLPKDKVLDMIPMKRFGTAEEVANVIEFLISEKASYITGQVISVNGGLYLWGELL